MIRRMKERDSAVKEELLLACRDLLRESVVSERTAPPPTSNASLSSPFHAADSDELPGSFLQPLFTRTRSTYAVLDTKTPQLITAVRAPVHRRRHPHPAGHLRRPDRTLPGAPRPAGHVPAPHHPPLHGGDEGDGEAGVRQRGCAAVRAPRARVAHAHGSAAVPRRPHRRHHQEHPQRPTQEPLRCPRSADGGGHAPALRTAAGAGGAAVEGRVPRGVRAAGAERRAAGREAVVHLHHGGAAVQRRRAAQSRRAQGVARVR